MKKLYEVAVIKYTSNKEYEKDLIRRSDAGWVVNSSKHEMFETTIEWFRGHAEGYER